ncbi:MAG: hypothetical protein GY946_20015, partial [bacterium]|nr:hypothetical protein [bacterium]
FLGAAVGPGREVDIHPLVEDFFEYAMPKLSGQEPVSFLRTFLGLFHEIEAASRHFPIKLTPLETAVSHDELEDILCRRIDEVVFGFLDGVWEEESELPLSEAQSAMLTAIEEAARTYDVLLMEIFRGEKEAAAKPVTDLLSRIAETDERIETIINSLLEAFRADTSTKHPMLTSARALINELAFSKELPREAIRQCAARRDEMVPIFLSILSDYVQGRP